MSLYLGIDTSNYTTSIAVCGEKEVNLRKIIDVKEGERKNGVTALTATPSCV